MAELDDEEYRAASQAFSAMLAEVPPEPTDPTEEQLAVVEAYFSAADALANRIVEAGAQRAGAVALADQPLPTLDDPGGDLPGPPGRIAEQANEEGAQLAALVGDVMGDLGAALAVHIGPGGTITDLAAHGPDEYELDPDDPGEMGAFQEIGPDGQVVFRLPDSYDPGFVISVAETLPDLRPVVPRERARFDRTEPAPREMLNHADPAEVLSAADHIFDETAAHVGGNLLGCTVGGILQHLDIRVLTNAVLEARGGQHGSLLKRIIWRAARSVATWVNDLFALAGEHVAWVAEELVGHIRSVGLWAGRPLVRSSVALNHTETFRYLEQHGTVADPQSVVASFDRRLHQLTKGQKGVSICLGLLLAAPAAGPVVAVVASLLAIWLASDHLGVPVGGFRGHPDWHRPDLAL
jgi:hypothetical protein